MTTNNKEEILEKRDITKLGTKDDFYNDILNAMEEYAKNVAIEFAEWKELNFHEFDLGIYISFIEPNPNRPRKKYNLDDLYSLWEQTKKK